ncbi:hypothetical protein [Agathobacter rectalis]|uniref:hypothetical protein n=1 Tax=Agathobacter rectalis TaxID=39491 RepID=UPI0027D331C4|nr:hypothetical protein [Agathobacter rectalis]MCB7108400.1 PcfJ domain-containing protein [Agathobacter rectalis]MCG4811721.1 PcfJ domain-containing protein [Agathobacter rectalis]
MRKGQIAILNEAQQYELNDNIISILKREDLTLKQLNDIVHYCYAQIYIHNQNQDDIYNEVLRIVENKWISGFTLPYGLCGKDTLLNSSKKRNIFKLYDYLNIGKYRKENPSKCADMYNLYNLYVELLYNDIQFKHIKSLYRLYKKDKTILNCFNNYRLPNINNSNIVFYTHFLEYIINELDKGETFHNYVFSNRMTEQVFNKNCENIDLNKMLFEYFLSLTSNIELPYDETNFDKYFIKENGVYYLNFEKIVVEKYPPITKAVLKSFDFKLLRNSYSYYNNIIQMNEDIFDKYKQLVMDNGITVTLNNIKSISTKIVIKTNGTINIYIREYKGNTILSSGKLQTYDETKSNKNDIVIFPNGDIYKKTKNEKLVPISFKELYALRNLNNDTKKLVDCIISEVSKMTPIFKDISRDFEITNLFPIKFNDLYKYHTKNELMKDMYGLAKDLPINYNKININLSYLIIKSYNYVNDRSKKILIQLKDKDNSILKLVNRCITKSWQRLTYKRKVFFFLQSIIIYTINEKTDWGKTRKKYIEENLNFIAENILDAEFYEFEDNCADDMLIQVGDYVNMCIYNNKRVKPKVDLSISNIHTLIEKHNDVSWLSRKSGTKPVKVPKDSVFNDLRKILPKEFEWIKNRKRLILETELQHHCVWSYADKISSDMCAIYSYVDKDGSKSLCNDGKPKRYTIEFNFNKQDGTYYVVQVQGKYDAVNSSDVQNYIYKILNEKQLKETA